MTFNKNNQKGITLVELMVSIGVLSIVTTLGFTYYNQSRKNLREIQFLQVMRTIAKRLDKVSQNPEAIAFSAAQASNRELANCVWTRELGSDNDYRLNKIRGSDTNLTFCDAIDPEKQVEFDLYVPPKDLDNYNAERRRISGGKNELWYDITGKRGCNSRDPKCIINVKTYFWATCPRGANQIREGVQSDSYTIPLAANCHRAQTINVRYQVTHVHKKDQRGKTKFRRQLPNIPRDDTFWLNGQASTDEHSTDHATPIDVAQLGRYSDYIGNCPKNQTLIFIKDSNPNCKCLPPYRQAPSALGDGPCILENHQCGPDERYMGTTIQGDKICQPVLCWDKSVTGFDFNCKPNGWLTEVRGDPSYDADGDFGNCTCTTTNQVANEDILSFEETCRLECKFIIKCCKER
ncbi:MAG: type II secretion system protein [Oligoflexales bacterium]